jgi:hypothetical protein
MYQLYGKVDRGSKAAHSKISLSKDYEMVGEVEANSRSEAVRKWFLGKDRDEESIPAPTVGDVVRDPLGKCFIFTPQGVWASVVSEAS